MKKDQVLDRKTFEAGKIFIKEGDEGYHAYLIQSGKCRVFTEREGEQIELAILEAGDIVGEAALIMDEPRGASVETLESTTVIIITREDFERKLIRVDDTVKGVLRLLSQRLETQNTQTIHKHDEARIIDKDADLIVESFCRKMSPERKAQFRKQILPHMNNLIKSLKKFKTNPPP